MMQEDEYRKYFEVLEVTPEASFAEVREAYNHLKELYSADSIVLSPLETELSDEWKEEVLEEIEEAYAKLSQFFESPQEKKEIPLPDNSVRAEIAEIRNFSGSALRHIREKLGVELHELALSTKISKRYLKNIEEEKFKFLPEKVFLRGYLKSYAKYLSLDQEKVVRDYMNLYAAWEKGNEE